MGFGLVRILRRAAFRLRRAQLSRDLSEELDFHRLLKEQQHLRNGLSAQAAGNLSKQQMGNMTLAREDSRELWSFVKLERLFQDLRYATRIFVRAPLFTAIAALSLALGIGGNAAMFSLVNTLLVRPLPYFQPQRLIRVTGIYPRAAVQFFQQRSRGMDVAAVSTPSELNLTARGEAIRVSGSAVSASLLSVLGVSVARGRNFEAGEDSPGRDGIVILSDSLWRHAFGADPTIVGSSITLNGVHRQVIGVMPPDFSFPSANVQLWFPMRLDSSNFLEYWAGEFVPLIGRLRPGAAILQAQSEIRTLVSQFRRTFPYPMARDWNSDAAAIPLQQDLVGDVRRKLILLLSSVSMVLLIACVNIASLLLSRATARRKEIALRAALGAGRARIIRQLLTESVFLALIGGSAGVLVGTGALSIFKSVLPSSLPGLARAAIDWNVVAAVAALALFAGLAFGIAPALSASQIDLTDALKTGSQRGTGGVWTRLRSWLIAAQVALTLVLVVGAGLLIKSLYRLSEADPGFEPRGILTVRMSPNQSLCIERPACIALYARLAKQAEELPGVAGASVANTVPLDGNLPTLAVDVEGHPKSADYPAPMLWAGAVSPEFFRMLHIPLLAGREFARSDGAKSEPVLLISASTARRFWPVENPVGKHIKPAGSRQWRTVVGVVGDVRQYTLSQGLPTWVAGAIYMPYAQSTLGDGQIPASMTLLVRAADSARLRSELRRLAEDQNPDIPVGGVQPLEEIVSGSISAFRSTIQLFISFAGVALLLAAMGIYGLVSYWVSQRTYEIGLRMAIGATRRCILRMVLAQSFRITLCGIAGGIVAALALTRFLASLLYEVGATDPWTLLTVAVLILAVAFTASCVPAWRAAQTDPTKSLRIE